MNPSSRKVGILDYGLGNVRSVCSAIEYLGYGYQIIKGTEELDPQDAFVLPGVGAFREGMRNLRKRNLSDKLSEQVMGKCEPILGICLGMQLFADSSEEKGHTPGLGWINGTIQSLSSITEEPLPHVGWNSVNIEKRSPLYTKNEVDAFYYFDHSYYFQCNESQYVSGYSKYGNSFPVSIQKENIFGVQFHPEKSQNNGLRMLRSFFEEVGF